MSIVGPDSLEEKLKATFSYITAVIAPHYFMLQLSKVYVVRVFVQLTHTV